MSDDNWKKTSPLAICLFGPMEIWRDGEPVTDAFSPITRQILALLVLDHDRPVLRRHLAEKIWPEDAFAESEDSHILRRNNFRQQLRKLRTALGEKANHLFEPEGLPGDALQFNLGDAAVDVVRFQSILRQSASDSRGRRLEEAVRYYQGHLLPEVAAEWITSTRSSFLRQYTDCVMRLADQAVLDGAQERAEGWLREALRVDPIREEVVEKLLTLFARAGRTREMEQVYADLVTNLTESDRRSTTPNLRTESLYRSLRRRAAPHNPAPPVGARAGRGTRFPLPPILRPLIGQQALCDDIDLLIQSSPLVTLIGPGGIGKTRIAVELAHRNADLFTDGVVFVDFTVCPPGSDRPTILQRLIGALGSGGIVGLDPGGGIAGILRNRQMLVVLDNCEHVLDAVAVLLAELLQKQPDVKILATSREAIRLDGEVVRKIPSLSFPPTSEASTPDAIAQSDSAQVFLRRVSQPALEITAAVADDIGWICRTLEGIPLAIEIAAAAMDDFQTTADFVGSMRGSLRFLRGGDRTRPDRYQTVDATIRWSYDLLRPDEQRFLRSLCTLPAGASLATVAEVTGFDDALTHLRNLESRSLVLSAVPPGLTTELNTHRFRLLEPVRQFALDIFAEDETRTLVCGRQAAIFVRLVDEVSQLLQQPRQTEGLNRLDAERGNFDFALEWCLRDDAVTEDARAAIHLLSQLWRLWMIRGSPSSGEEWIRRAYRRRDAAPVDLRLTFLLGAGNLAMLRGESGFPRECFAEALALARAASNRPIEAAALANLATIARSKGNYDEARTLLLQAQPIFRDLGRLQQLAFTYGNLANVSTDQSRYDEAIESHRQAIQLLRETDATHDVILALNNLAHTFVLAERAAEAIPVLQEVFLRSEQTENLRGTVHGLTLAIGLLDKLSLYQNAVQLMSVHETLRERLHLALPIEVNEQYLLQKSKMAAALGQEAFDAQYRIGTTVGERDVYAVVMAALGRATTASPSQ